MKKVESVLEKCIQDVYQASSLEDGKEKMKKVLDECKIKETDKKKMLMEVEKIANLSRLQFYATNCLFKYEGLGVGSKTVVKK